MSPRRWPTSISSHVSRTSTAPSWRRGATASSSPRRRRDGRAPSRQDRRVRTAHGAGMIRPAELIEAKRDGREHSADEIVQLVLAYACDEVPDYQMAAWCMAVYF